MVKRVLAWILLIGFVLLLANIVFFHFFQMQSVAAYAVIAIWFVFSDKTSMSRKAKISDEVINKMNADRNAEGNIEDTGEDSEKSE